MAFSSKVDNIVDVIFSKQLVSEFSVSDITFYEEATLIVDIILNRSQVSGISQCIKNDNFDIFIFIFFVVMLLDIV